MFKSFNLWSNKRTLYSLSSSEDDRAAALFHICESGDPRLVETVIDWLIESPTITPRDLRTAASALPDRNTREALARLESYLTNPVRRQRAFQILGYLGEPAGPMLKALAAKRDPLAMEAYEAALGRKAVPFFLHLARLSEFGGARCVFEHGSPDEVDDFLLLLLEKDTLANLQSALEQYLRPRNDAQRAILAAFRSEKAGRGAGTPESLELSEDTLPFLAAALTNTEPAMRDCASRAIIDAPPPHVFSTLLPLLRHKDTAVRKQVAVLMRDLDWEPDNREEQLRYCIAADDFSMFVEAGAESVPQLLKLIEHNPVAVAQALGEIGDARAVPALIGMLKSHLIAVQVAAAEALGAIRAEEATMPLLKTLHRMLSKAKMMKPEPEAAEAYRAILKALHQCLPASPPAELLDATRLADQLQKTLS
jgi:HEAT repeat protein